MSNDFFDQVLDISRQVTARLVEQLEDARQKKLTGMQRDLQKLSEQRARIEAELAQAQTQFLQLSETINGLHQEIATIESYDVRSGIFNTSETSATTTPTPEPKPRPAAARREKVAKVVAPTPEPEVPDVVDQPTNDHVPERVKTLKEYIVMVLEAHDKPMSAQDIADGVLALGYVTKSKDFRNTVKGALGEMRAKKQAKHIPTKGYVLA